MICYASKMKFEKNLWFVRQRFHTFDRRSSQIGIGIFLCNISGHQQDYWIGRKALSSDYILPSETTPDFTTQRFGF